MPVVPPKVELLSAQTQSTGTYNAAGDDESSRNQVQCSSLAKMSPQNCLANLSPRSIGSSPQKRRRSDEGVGVKGEAERNPSDACSSAHHRRARNCGKRSKTFRDFSTSDEAVTTQDQRARSQGFVARQPRQSSVEQNGVRKDRASAGTGAGSVSGVKRHSFDREA